MTTLFNLYGDAETIATTTQITDEDILASKKAATEQAIAEIEAHEILSPRDLPDSELMAHCTNTVNNIILANKQSEDRDIQRLVAIYEPKPYEFRVKALHKYISDKNVPLLDILKSQNLQPDAILNCLAVAYHFEQDEEDLGSNGHVLDPVITEKQPFYKEHPILTAVGILGIYMLLTKQY